MTPESPRSAVGGDDGLPFIPANETTPADPASLQRLLAWFSPAFPIGAFAYSAGLETAIADKRVRSPAALANWLTASLHHGAPLCDAIILAEAHRRAAAPLALAALADLALALIPAAERRAETLTLGAAFRAAAAAWPASRSVILPDTCPYPVALGAIAAICGLPLAATLVAYLASIAQSQISVAIRLVPLGQSDGLALLCKLEPVIAATAKKAEISGLEALGTMSFAADIAAMAHETLETRIFRS